MRSAPMIMSRRRKSKKIVVMLGEEAQLTDGGPTMAWHLS